MAILAILGGLLALAAGVCWIIILIDAFKNEIWKGIVGLLCGLYLLYYAFAEYQAPNKWTIVGVAIGGWIVGIALMFAGGAGAMLQSVPPVH
jgi:hypothetical protein